MDDCQILKKALDEQLQIYRDGRNEAILRAILSTIGFEWVYDLIKGKGINWTILLDLLTALDLAAAIAFLVSKLKEVGLKKVGGEIIKKFGPWALAIAAVILVVNVASAISKINSLSSAFDNAVKVLYNSLNCEDKDKIFREKGIAIPK
jgi:hypothetical protein